MLKQKQIIPISIFLLCLITMFPISTAAININIVLTIVILLYYYYEDKRNRLTSIPLNLIVSIVIFCGGILVASLAIADKDSMILCKKNILWFAYFFSSYLLASRCRCNLIIIPAMMLAVLGLSLPAIKSFILTGERSQGIFSNPNYLAFMFDITLPFCTVFCFKFWKEYADLWVRIIISVVTLIGYFGLYTTGSRGAFLGVSFSLVLVYVFAKLRSKGIIISILVLILTGMMAYSGPRMFKGTFISRSYDRGRVLMIESSYAMWKDHKIFGVGLANWNKEFRNKYISKEEPNKRLLHSHNMYMQYFSTTGLVGGISFVFLIFTILFVLGSNTGIKGGYYTYAMLGSLLAFAIHGFFDVLTISWVMKPFYVLLGISIAEITKDKAVASYKDI